MRALSQWQVFLKRTVMEILGHKDPRMTLRYQHLTPAHLKSAMRVLEHRPIEDQAELGAE